MIKYYIKLWDGEKIQIDSFVFQQLEYGTYQDDRIIIEKYGKVSVPVKNIKLWYCYEENLDYQPFRNKK